MGNVTAQAEALLRSKGLRFSKIIRGDWISISLDPAPGSDFSLFIEDYSDGNVNLGAHRVGADKDEQFFYIPYEPVDFDNPKALEERALREFELLISNPISIRRSRGLLFENWEANVRVGSETKRLSGASAFRWGFKFPPMSGREQIFESPSLTAGAKDG